MTICNDNGVITEGKVRQKYASADLAAMGMTDVSGQALDSAPAWISNTQLLTVWPNADGKLLGEDIYFGEDPMTTLTPYNES